jgi:hypothetical protein
MFLPNGMIDKNRRRVRTLFAALSLLAVPMSGHADESVALVTDVSGRISPPVGVHEELYAGTSLVLFDGKIEFLHYKLCEWVSLQGGEVELNEEGFTARYGDVLREKRRCPKKQRFASDTFDAGTVLATYIWRDDERPAPVMKIAPRTIPIILPDLLLTPRPSITLGGNRRRTVTNLHFYVSDFLLLDAELTGLRFDWPAGREPLKVGIPYRLDLVSGETVVKKIPITVYRDLEAVGIADGAYYNPSGNLGVPETVIIDVE